MSDPRPDQSRVAADWRARGFSCEVWTDPPGQVWADFVHDVDELVMTIDGDVEFEFGGKTYRPGPGEELLIPAGAPHTVRNRGDVASHWLFGYRR
jgi:mannose-6-phosphate isomerase-like protein (cupin superfamily)